MKGLSGRGWWTGASLSPDPFKAKSAFSVELWFKQQSYPDQNYPRLLQRLKIDGAKMDGIELGVNALRYLDGGELKPTPWGKPMFFNRRAGTLTDTCGSDAVLELNQWYHFVGTYDGSTMRCYVNGVQTNPTPSTLNILDLPNEAMRVGDGGNWDGGFPGLIDELAIYRSALSADKVRAHYVTGLARLP